MRPMGHRGRRKAYCRGSGKGKILGGVAGACAVGQVATWPRRELACRQRAIGSL